MKESEWTHVRVWRGPNRWDIEIKPNRWAFWWQHKRALAGHYLRWLTSPLYRALWKEFRTYTDQAHDDQVDVVAIPKGRRLG